MNLRKYFMKTQPANKEPFCEEVGLFEDAVNAILDGSTPWEIDPLRATICLGVFNLEEQRHLESFVDMRLAEKRKEIMRVALTKVLTGNGLEKDLATKISTLGRKTEAPKGLTSGIISQTEYELQKKLWQSEQMMKQFQNSVQNSQLNSYIDAGNAAQQRIENPFSLK